ncbi:MULTISPECIES: ubiquinol-cytochrome c reductase iron-sulfur subunit [Iodidimonas]|uniref:Ubiquinol-cytochrome c reductase iron-sulfur subunit n=1 Tax=Iodidimonas nitroreducens TaxID=1236968 RepID=A0A5A7N744_9PROT|nr:MULTISPECIES: ubiquinol-cytochrome c reductase iron-sulfur subunit [Iodidimonas]GAK34099.1 ubiquinol-cytochrome c reductase iron-sulfur subunit [alpha proteobacterium Q-1]GER03807.1 ubiquinol-cytochrome c reductase iron-sulfur subunit [Iodidimonas nitroreducens]
MSSNPSTVEQSDENGTTRRDFLYIATTAMGAVGAAYAVWPFIHQMNPSKDTLALASAEVDISAIAPGQSIKVMWRGKPVFVRNRTEKEVAEAKAVDISNLRDPQTDAERTKPGHEQWLVMVGVCTHLGCIPLGEAGEFGGWFCPCHGSHYDTAGRIRKGPAPLNLEVPDYQFISDDRILIG